MINLIIANNVTKTEGRARAKRVEAVALALIFACGLTCANALGADEGRLIKVTAKRFEFDPKEIILKRGQPAVFQLSSLDRSHGFSVPALNIRADVVPGKVTEVKVTPEKNGDFDFFCDIFCGSGHESMSGKIKVTD